MYRRRLWRNQRFVRMMIILMGLGSMVTGFVATHL